MLRFLASIRLAVIIILSLAVITAIGTITEARYDAEVAQKLVYQSVYMYIILGLLSVNLIAVMVDRWPWKQHHAGFVLAHIGILFILLGAWVTQKFGIDGTMTFGIGEQRNTVVVRERELNIYSSFGGGDFRNMYHSEVDFLRHPPTPDKPFVVNLGGDEMRFIRYENFAFRESEMQATESGVDGPAVRFQLENPNVNLTQWLRRESRRDRNEIDLGPAKVILAQSVPPPEGRNAVVLVTRPESDRLEYVIYNKDNTIRKKGFVSQSETVETGWMGMKFRLLRYLPHARENITYSPSPTASPLSTSALLMAFNGQEYWVGLNSALRLYLSDRMYIVSYGFRQLELAFPLKLEAFRIGKYEGTERAASYESEVDVPGQGRVTISMNEPLKFQGFTFYQSSFEKDERGQPVASVLSVNRDPGRWIKYFGSLILVLGCVVLFYFKRVRWLDSLTGAKKKGST
jgi:hypothetical protein